MTILLGVGLGVGVGVGVGVALFEPKEQQMMLEMMGEDFDVHQINRMIKDQTYNLENEELSIKFFF